MAGIHPSSPLEFWEDRIKHLINKNKTVQKRRLSIIKDRAKYAQNEKRQNNR
ncbi:MAG: hypothetical protein ACFFCE_10965 [Promethearchaeota archaeon]